MKAEGVAKHEEEIVKGEVKAAEGQNESNNLILNLKGAATEKKNNSDLDVFNFSSSSDESKFTAREPVNSKEKVKGEVVNIGLGRRVALARKLKMKPFPLSGIQVFKQVRYLLCKTTTFLFLTLLGQSFATFFFSGSTSVW